jgi:DNA-binding MarR family transcriptional regulator
VTRATIEAALQAHDELHARLVRVNTPDVVDVSLTLAQLKTIYVVATAGPMPMGSLADRLGTRLSTTSGAVDRLVRDGLLHRREDPGDRRIVLVEATPAALEQIERMSELGRSRFRELLSHLPSDEDVRTVERAMRILADALARLYEETR